VFSPEHDELRDVVRIFVEREITPHVEAWERAGDFPHRELFPKAGVIGLFGAKVDPSWGGTGPDLAADAVITEELARCGSGGVTAALGAHKDLALQYLSALGDRDQRERWLRPGVAGELIGALAVTEPGGGSDVAAVRTRAIRAGEGWTLSGTKTFVTNGPIADFLVVAAKTDPDAGARGISLFVVETGAPGLATRRIDTVGWRTSHTGEVVLDECRVPARALLGDENRGFAHIMRNLQWERLVMALSSVTGAARTLELGIAYGRERKAFGRPIGKFQVWRHRFADLASEIDAARSLAYHALRKAIAGEEATREAAMAKWLATELAWRVADESLQIHGGYGYMMEFPVQRAWRDSRLGPIGGGTTEILKEIVGRSYDL